MSEDMVLGRFDEDGNFVEIGEAEMSTSPFKLTDETTRDNGDYFFIVTMTTEFGIVVSDEAGQPMRQLVTKKWERIEALMETWAPRMLSGWQVVVTQVTSTKDSWYTKK